MRAPPTELTPLAVSLLNDDAYVGRILAKRSQQQLMQGGLHGAAAAAEAAVMATQTGFLMPTFSPSARAPWLSNTGKTTGRARDLLLLLLLLASIPLLSALRS